MSAHTTPLGYSLIDSQKHSAVELIISLYSMATTDGVTETIDRAFVKVVQIRKLKELENPTSFLEQLFLDDNIPNAEKRNMDHNEIVGLVGEILSERFHLDNGNGIKLFTKWEGTGTSKSRGIDIILSKDRTLIFVECKHCHKTLIGTSNFANILGKTFSTGFEFGNENNFEINLARTYARLGRAYRAGRGSGDTQSSIQEKLKLIESCVRQQSYRFNVCVIADGKVLKSTKLDDILNSVNLNSFSPIFSLDGSPKFSRDGTTILIDKLEDICQKLISKHGVKQVATAV